MGSKKNKLPRKKNQLKGIALIRHTTAMQQAETQNNNYLAAASSPAPGSNKNEFFVNESSRSTVSASEYKIKNSVSNSSNPDQHHLISNPKGVVLVDVKALCGYLNTVSICKVCDGCLVTLLSDAKRQGFAMPFIGVCNVCKSETILFNTSTLCNKTGVLILSDFKTKATQR